MPIDYKEYHPKWSLISRLIRFKRAGNLCEWCDAPNGRLIYRLQKGKSDWALAPEGHEIDVMHEDGVRFVKIVLTVAHLDHNKKNNRFDNLAALCQRCHLTYDAKHHATNRKYGNRKDNLSLF